MTIELPDIPQTGQELEDYVAALFHAAGHFVEKNVTAPNVLELDIVATDYEQEPPRVILAEAKSGNWGYGDLFKVVGWMRYLRIGEGAFLCQGVGDKGDKDLDHVRSVFEPLKVVVVNLEDFADAVGKFTAERLPAIEYPDEVEHWRWAHQIERLLTKELSVQARREEAEGPTAVLQYHRLVNDGIFFERKISERIQALYTAYQSHPRLALSCAREMDGHGFDPEPFFWHKSDRITEALMDGEHDLLQAAFYAEHRAKLAILKSAIDLSCRAPKLVKRLVGVGAKKTLPDLPGSFIVGLRWLVQQPTYRQYARLWQTFLWCWGGFYLEDRKEQEFGWLSAHTGVPTDEIETALQAFDQFFPAGPSWVTTISSMSKCVIVKMVPVMFRGMGANHRRVAYNVENYKELGYHDYTGRDMARWHNRTYGFLSGQEPP